MSVGKKHNEKIIEVVKNVDFRTRILRAKNILIASDYADEGLLEVAVSLARSLELVYKRAVAVRELSEDGPSGIDVEEQGLVFHVMDVKRNVQETRIPEKEVDAAIIVRTNRSIGAKKKRYVTNMIKDANLPVMGLIYNRK